MALGAHVGGDGGVGVGGGEFVEVGGCEEGGEEGVRLGVVRRRGGGDGGGAGGGEGPLGGLGGHRLWTEGQCQ